MGLTVNVCVGTTESEFRLWSNQPSLPTQIRELRGAKNCTASHFSSCESARVVKQSKNVHIMSSQVSILFISVQICSLFCWSLLVFVGAMWKQILTDVM